MTTTSTKYVPWDPMRICDICGDLQRKSNMRRLVGGMWACPNEPQWRDAVELSKANARQKPFRILPVKDAKPENWSSPDSYEGDDGEILNFIARRVATGTRYESVVNGDPAPLPGYSLQAYGWSAQYLYGMIVENKRPLRMINLAKSSLLTIATALMLRQVGTTLAGQTTANFGAFLESGATVYQTQDAASCGLAMLYAYRVFGTKSYLVSARLAASYLRNVQSIGKCAVFFTSSDSAGTARLYTGAVCSEVSTTFGGDPSERFYSNHQFFPQDLLTLKFWNELKTTDGDQTIGTSGIPDGFVASPAQLLSTSIEEMRVFWLSGVRDSAGETYSGLSETTPREYFNAYPFSKLGFSHGTGRWEFQDGDASTGTNITAQNFAMALGSLFAVEGASAQVTAVNTWLRSFASNATFEIPANESQSALARSVLGTFDPVAAPTTLLTVRDSTASYTAIKKNGSGLYDWGAFGLLAPLWGNRTLSSFTESRKLPLGRNQRFLDGQRSDGDHFDWITLRGESGLSYQTAFTTNTNGYDAGSTAFAAGTSGVTSLPSTGLVFYVEGDKQLETAAGKAVAWRDQGTLHQDLITVGGSEPSAGNYTINGIPTVNFPLGDVRKYMYNTTTMKDRNGAPLSSHAARTVMAVMLPQTGFTGFGFNITGGPVFSFRETPCFQCLFDMESFFRPNGFYLFDNAWRFDGAEMRGPDTADSTYANKPTLAIWRSSGYPTVFASVNGTTDLTLTPSTQGGLVGVTPPNGFLLGNDDNAAGFPQPNYQGAIAAVYVWDYYVPGQALSQAVTYASNKFALGLGGLSIGMVNDAVRAAQFGAAFRINPSDPMQV